MKTIFASVLFALALPALAFGQALPLDKLTPSLPTAGERQAAEIASWATVVAALALDARATIAKCRTQDDCYRAATLAGLRMTTVYGSTFLLKKMLARQRPCAPACGIDDPYASFPSAHTAAAFSTVGGPSISFSMSLGFGTAAGRVMAKKHWLSDTIAGAGIGLLASRIR